MQGRPHAGLGMPNAAANLPAPQGYGNGAPAAYSGEKYSLFVTNIPEAVQDVWLERLFNVSSRFCPCLFS